MSKEEHIKAFMKELTAANDGHRMILDTFSDFCRMAALSLESPFTMGETKKEIEAEYERTIAKYGSVAPFARMMAVLIEALHDKREEFLGAVHEQIGAANVRNGQFFTPNSVATVMARVLTDGLLDGHKAGHIIRINDPACGASVTLIAQAEELIRRGVRQGDILIDAGDVDIRACDMSYAELSLLGYAAIVRHENALSRQIISRPRFTPGYFLHRMPMRRGLHELA